MPLDDRDRAYLWDITEACKDVIAFTKDISYEKFTENKLVRYAVERQIVVIGEAANHLSDGFIADTANIPWKRIIGLRNIIAHEYGEILAERIWLTAKNHIPELLDNVVKHLYP